MDRKAKEHELWEKYNQTGDKQVKKELIHSLTPLIRSQANKYKNSGLPYQALELEGRRLASKAIEDYDPNQGTQLNTYVTTHLQKLNRYTNQYQNVGHIPEPRALMLGKYHTIFSNLEEEKGREPTIGELADTMNVSQAEIMRLQSELRKDLHMKLPADDEDAGGFYEYIAPEEGSPALENALFYVYHDSDPIDQKIIEYLFGYGGSEQITSFSKIKQKLKLTESELSKRRTNIAKKIREIS